MKPVAENESLHLGQNEMAGLKGKSGPPGDMNAFKHGLAAIQKRRDFNSRFGTNFRSGSMSVDSRGEVSAV